MKTFLTLTAVLILLASLVASSASATHVPATACPEAHHASLLAER